MDSFITKKNHNLDFKNASAAIILNDKNEYLVQLRDNKEEIFYPNHWGLFGGAAEKNEKPIKTISREIAEEISIEINDFKYFTSFKFDLNFINKTQIERTYYAVKISSNHEKLIRLNEGKKYKFFNSKDILGLKNIVPYDSFAIWMHINYLLK